METQVLQPRRQVWAEICAWTAATLKAEDSGDNWIDFALVARDLAGDRKLAGLPLIANIVDATIEVFKQR